MNNKYAPIVALTVLIIIVLVALGWFLAIKPHFAEASSISAQSSEVDQNTTQIQQQTAKLSKYESDLAALQPLDEAIGLNLPSTVDIAAYRDRITAAAKAAKVNIISLDFEGSYEVDGWQIPPQYRVSNSIAKLFETGPVHTPGSEPAATTETATPEPGETGAAAGGNGGYTPPVTPSNETGPVVSDLNGLPITIKVTGAYAATSAFLKALTDPDDQIFLVYESEQEARPASSTSLAGVPDAKNGDVITQVTGAFYLLNPDTAVVDDDQLEKVSAGGKSPFAPSKGVAGSTN